MGQEVAYVSVEDHDTGLNGKVFVEIETSVPQDAWTDVSKEGQLDDTLKLTFDWDSPFIKLNHKLDREKVDKYTIQFKACDNGNKKRYFVIIAIFLYFVLYVSFTSMYVIILYKVALYMKN